jgi:hypothetical protein
MTNLGLKNSEKNAVKNSSSILRPPHYAESLVNVLINVTFVINGIAQQALKDAGEVRGENK